MDACRLGKSSHFFLLLLAFFFSAGCADCARLVDTVRLSTSMRSSVHNGCVIRLRHVSHMCPKPTLPHPLCVSRFLFLSMCRAGLRRAWHVGVRAVGSAGCVVGAQACTANAKGT
jgi:hypothetical protein